jgi:murein DD-endopeptidase MepM/ murein hydrolase activator NlpD
MPRETYHTIIVMPSTPGKRFIRFSLPSFFLHILYVVAVAILFWAGVGTWSIYHHKRITQRSLLLAKENRLAIDQLQYQKQRIKYLDQQLKKIRGQAAFVRKFLGLEPQGMREGKIAQGGEEVSPQAFSLLSELSAQENPEGLQFTDSAKVSLLSSHQVNEISNGLDQVIRILQDKQQEMEHTPSISPVDPHKSWISSGFGVRISPFTGKKQFHLGIDIAGWRGTSIMATAKGKVIFVGSSRTLGLMIRIRHNSTFTSEYAHLLKAKVKIGQYVERGEIIAYMGDSGWSTGYHLHYGIKKNRKYTNPFAYMLDWEESCPLLTTGKKEA